jgi:tRNA pseudouridine38-40 synthase
MRNIVLTIQYDGTRFDGWQRQGNTANTVQGRLESVLRRMTGETVELHGSGRTDAGVHALAQVANFHTDCPLSCAEMMRYVNQYLPQDAAVTAVREAAPRFHARLNAAGKHYRYRIRVSDTPEVFSRRYVWALPEKLDTAAMAEAAALLLGKHDFMSFCDNRRMKKSTVRTLERLEITPAGDELLLDFYGDGFLYHMARILTGTLVEVGRGNTLPMDMTAILAAGAGAQAGPRAPPPGLILMAVCYG